MKVLCVIEPGRAPSTRLRLGDCVTRYRQAGIEVTTISARRSSLRERLRLVREAGRHDVVVLFKTIGFSALDLYRLHRRNPRIIFDYDDAVMFREQKYGRAIRVREFEKFVRTIEHCSAVVAGNAFLARFAEACGKPTTILPTPVDVGKYAVRDSEPNDLTIGWVGLSDGFVYLRHIQPALQELTKLFPGLKLQVISDKPFQLDGVNVDDQEWKLEREQTNLSRFTIGIMPLTDTLWTRGKCGYKILQYMAAGIPSVASAVGANIDIVTHGENGFLARTNEDWVRMIATLADDAVLRKKFALKGRQLVENSYSLGQFSERYIRLMREVGGRGN
ncbi:MAG TPA: glycosyltransferase family 4 protein [Chthoniobacterales bacterium]|nr:glycosyltransferase family 4 protein [Chthoniobacterales bacterium]